MMFRRHKQSKEKGRRPDSDINGINIDEVMADLVYPHPPNWLLR
jgi:hypothetical protein